MSRRTPRRAVALVLAASVGLVAASAVQAAPRTTGARLRTSTAIQQQLSGRTWIESTWALLRGFMPKNGSHPGGGPPSNSPGNGNTPNVRPEGPGMCPIGKPGS